MVVVVAKSKRSTSSACEPNAPKEFSTDASTAATTRAHYSLLTTTTTTTTGFYIAITAAKTNYVIVLPELTERCHCDFLTGSVRSLRLVHISK